MAVNTKKIKITLKDIENITEQILKYKTNNLTISEIICPRCGKNMILDEIKNSHSVTCEDENCISYTARGI